MERFKCYLIENFEQFFVLLLLVSVAGLNYFIPYKLAFLNFYFIPILLAGYYLNSKKTILGSVFCILLVIIYAYLYPASFAIKSTFLDLSMFIIVWGSFLILTGAIVGRIQDRLRREIAYKASLIQDLSDNKVALDQVTQQLHENTELFEKKVQERTEHLEKAKVAVENLKEMVEETLYNTMDPSVVKLIIEKRLRTEKRTLSIMFSDLENFTHYSEEHKPEVVITELNKFLGDMESILLSYGAHIDKYIGDGIMAEFGAPIANDRHALMAVVAGLKMQERMKKGGYPWKMRIGISTGELIIGLIGRKRQAYTALGDVVNVANRIQEICDPGTVTVDEATFENVRLFVDANRKTVQSLTTIKDPELVKEINTCTRQLDQNPDDVEILKKIGILLMRGKDYVLAHDYIRRALELDPNDDHIKVAFAENSLMLEECHDVAIRGKKEKLHLYEIIHLQDPLKKRDKIPRSLYDRYSEQITKQAKYPEDLILPIECLDGCVGHSRVVGFLSYAIADMLGLPDQEKSDILMAGYLFDIGKIIIPHHLLNRPGTLNKDEYEIVTKHCREGVRILKKMGYVNEGLFEIIEYHHEKYDGSGYPNGISGDAIPLGARILAVADAYDAMTSWRPNRNSWDYLAAFVELESETAWGKFDPKIMECLGKLLEIEKRRAPLVGMRD
ncbi:MAG: HD domain-containing phosphohydrolase [bacterium]